MVRTSTRIAVGAVLASLVLLVLAGVAVAAPSNDDFSSPLLLTGATGLVAASNVDATLQADEPPGSAWVDGQTVWFEWDAPENGTLDLGANADWELTHVSVYAGVPSPTSEPVVSEMYAARFDVVGGTRYFISVDTEGGAGDFYVSWTFAASSAPPNDTWSFMQPIEGASGSVEGTTVGATAEPGEPSGAGHSVWFHWIAPADGVVSFSAGSGFAVDAYVGWSLSQLTPLGATAPVAAGDVLTIRVDGAETGSFTLSWQMGPAAAPTVTVPDSIAADANAPEGRTIEFVVSAVDWKGRALSTTCSKLSGYTFPIGTTTVTCSASDAGGRVGSASFDVHVKGVAEQLADLRTAVVAAQLDAKTTGKLTSQLDDVRRQLDAGRTSAVCGGLSDFVDAVQKQSGKSIPTTQADAFVTAAWRMRAVVNCA